MIASFILYTFCIASWSKVLSHEPNLLLKVQKTGTCLSSFIGPSSGELCQQWNANVDAAPYFDNSRRLFFVGAGDSHLYVIDADNGQHLAQIRCSGRVNTGIIFDKDGKKLYFGTEGGVLYAIDAYSFQPIFSIKADSKLNNDLVVSERVIYFTSALGTVFAVDMDSGTELWRLLRPKNSERLRLSNNSNLIVIETNETLMEQKVLIAAHADGYLSVIKADGGKLSQNIVLGELGKNKAFPDIIAPMIKLGGTIYAASYSSGIFSVDLKSLQIRTKTPVLGVQQMASKDETIFAANAEELYAFKADGRILWKNNFFQLRTNLANYTKPFKTVNQVGKKVFLGSISRLLIQDNVLLMGTSLGALGVFNLGNGNLVQIVGNGLGLGPKIIFGADSVLGMSRNGSLVRYKYGT